MVSRPRHAVGIVLQHLRTGLLHRAVLDQILHRCAVSARVPVLPCSGTGKRTCVRVSSRCPSFH